MNVSIRPNPFVNNIVISFYLEKICKLKANIIDSSGKQIKELHNNIMLHGEQSILWDGKDNRNSELPAGIYFISLSSCGINYTEKIVKY